MAAPKKKREYSFHIPQEDLAEIEILAPLSIKQEKYLNDQENDIVVWGGAASAGKTQLSLLRLMLGGMWDKDYVAAVARNSQKQMKNSGSLWSTGCKLFAPYGVSSNKIELSWSFPSGAEVKCHHLDNNQDDWQGTQCTEMLVDESQQCLEDDVWYLTSRLRSKSKQKHQLRLTCNPLNTSFLCQWLDKAGYLLDTGLPNMEMDGVTTYMLQVAGNFEWYKSKKEIAELYGEEIAKMALSFVYYSATVYDNPYIRKHLPAYVYKLENLKSTERSRLLLGNWFASPDGQGYMERSWFKEVPLSEIPFGLPTTRCWDLASTKPHEGNKDPDFTRGIKCSYDRTTGIMYILDMKSCRDKPAIVQQLIENTAYEDGRDVYIGIPVDAGQSGKTVAEDKKARLSHMGHKVILCSARASKLKRAEPFLIALQEGKICVAPGVFNDDHYRELEAFDGGKCAGQHDDVTDSLADNWLQLTGNGLIPTLRINTNSPQYRRLGGETLL